MKNMSNISDEIPGTLYIISAPSGGGKTSLVRALTSQIKNLVISISHTTRLPRPGELNGVNYHFVSIADFQALLAQDIFLEHAEVFGCLYGTSKQWVSSQLKAGNDVILEIDWQGAEQIRKLFPQCVSVFIVPPSLAILRARLHERAQDSEDIIEKRMRQAQAEISHYGEFDYLIINDKFETAVEDLKSIVRTQRLCCVKQQKSHEKLLKALLVR